MIQRLFLIAISLSPTFASAGSVDQLVREVKAEKEAVEKKEVEKRNLLGELYSVNKELKKINSDRGRIEQNLKRAAENVQALTTLISQLGSKVDKQRDRLRARMKAMSKVSGQGVGRMLFGAKSSGELDTNLRLFRIVTERDFRLLKNYKGNLKVLGAQRGRLSNQEKKFSSLKRDLDEKEKTLASRVEQKNKMLNSVDSARILHMANLKRLKLETQTGTAANAELAKIRALEDLFQEQMFERRGALNPPAQAAVVRSFGIEEDRETGTKIRFKGQLFDVKAGGSVSSIFRGVVEFSGWLDGYGRTVILNHGDNYYSVYSNLDEVAVKEGQRVQVGQSVGEVSSSETFLGRGLYFEMRHFSEPIDPAVWWEATREKSSNGGKI